LCPKKPATINWAGEEKRLGRKNVIKRTSHWGEKPYSRTRSRGVRPNLGKEGAEKVQEPTPKKLAMPACAHSNKNERPEPWRIFFGEKGRVPSCSLQKEASGKTRGSILTTAN